MDILVVGASVAGLSVATALRGSGHDLTVAERAGAPRSGGVAIDVRGDALRTARRWGIHDDVVRARITANEVWNFVDEVGDVQASWKVAEQFYDSPEDVELLRDDLVDILAARVSPDTDMRFDEDLVELVPDDTGVWATFAGRAPQRFDLVVGADGLHSTVRRLAFGSEHAFLRHLGCYVGLVRGARSLADLDATYVFNRPGRVLMVAGGNPQPVAMFAFRSPGLEYDFRDAAAHKRLVLDAFGSDAGWRMGDALEELRDSQDFYFDAVAQARMTSWVRGRVVLVGDAGYGPSFFSGMGSSLAMLGAEVLAEGLVAGTPVEESLARYDVRMRDHVDPAHALAAEGMDLLFPASQDEIEARNRSLRAMSE